MQFQRRLDAPRLGAGEHSAACEAALAEIRLSARFAGRRRPERAATGRGVVGGMGRVILRSVLRPIDRGFNRLYGRSDRLKSSPVEGPPPPDWLNASQFDAFWGRGSKHGLIASTSDAEPARGTHYCVVSGVAVIYGHGRS